MVAKHNTPKIIASITLDKGIWIVISDIRWNGNSSGLRMSYLSGSQSTPQYPLYAYANTKTDNAMMTVNFCQKNFVVVTATQKTNIYFWIGQTSGSDLGYSNHTMYAFKIGN